MPRLLAAALALALFSFASPAIAADGAEVYRGHAAAKSGDPAYGPDFTHFEYVNPDAPKGGTVKLGAVGGFDSLNPFIIKGQAAGISRLLGTGFLYMALMERGDDEVFTQYGGLAETIEFPKDYSRVSFELHPDAVWHDGKAITASDVVWTFNTLREVGHPLYANYYADVEDVVAESEKRVTFNFVRAGNTELPLILGQLPILPEHYWTAEGRTLGDTTLEAPLGSGPYRVAEVDSPRTIAMERVQDWWAADLPAFKGQYNFDRIEIEYYRDATVILEAFKGGALDFRIENTARNWANAYDIPAVERGDIIKEEIEHDLPQGMQAFTFNLRREKFQDPLVRQALIELFDFEWMNRTIFFDSYTRTDSYFENSELASVDKPSAAELAILEPLREEFPEFVPASVFEGPYAAPVSDGSGRDRRMTRRALGLFKQAGFELQEGKLINGSTGEQLSFEMLINSPSFERIVLAYKQTLERVGVELTVRVVDTATYQRLVDEFDFDMISTVFGQSLSPGNEQLEFWGTTAADTPGSRNLPGIKNPAVDKLIDKVITAPNREELITRTRAMDRVLLANHYNIPAWHLAAFRIAYWSRFGHPVQQPRYGDPGLLTRWWIDADKAATIQTDLKR
ncbi:MAG: ABC transporter substrate-binding protein [Alphaproteobacteria bacterium]|nr:ABC transporter substrate-binding protein [Alphaproteobacteria bacterium SS10]